MASGFRAQSGRCIRCARTVANRSNFEFRCEFSLLWTPAESAKAKKRRGEHRPGSSGPPLRVRGPLINKPREERDVSVRDVAMLFAISNFTAVKRAAVYAVRVAVHAAVSSSDEGIWA